MTNSMLPSTNASENLYTPANGPCATCASAGLSIITTDMISEAASAVSPQIDSAQQRDKNNGEASNHVNAGIQTTIDRLQRDILSISLTLSITRKTGRKLLEVGQKLEEDKLKAEKALAVKVHEKELLNAEVIDLRKDLSDFRATLGSVRKELESAREEIGRRKKFEREVTSVCSKFTTAMEGFEAECEKLRDKHDSVKNENEHLRTQLENAQKSLIHAQQMLAAAQAHHAQLVQQQRQQTPQPGQDLPAQSYLAHNPPPSQQYHNNYQNRQRQGSQQASQPLSQSAQAISPGPRENLRRAANGTLPHPPPSPPLPLPAGQRGSCNSMEGAAHVLADMYKEFNDAAAIAASVGRGEAHSSNRRLSDAGEEDVDGDDEEEEDEEEEEEEEEEEKSYNDLARDFLRCLELKDYAGFCSNVAHLVTHEQAQVVNDWNALAIGALWLIAMAGDCHPHAHVQNVIESLPDVRDRHEWVLSVAKLHDHSLHNEPRDFYMALEALMNSNMVRQVSPLRDILNALRILQRIRFLNAFIASDNRFKRANQVSLRMTLFKTDFQDVSQLRQWLERELDGSDTPLILTNGGKNLAEVRALKLKLTDKLKGAENTYKKALDYLTTSIPAAVPGAITRKH